MEAIIQSSQYKIEELRKKLKIPTYEHIQSKGLAQVEVENETLVNKLINKNNEVVVLNKQVAELQQRIDSHIFIVIMPEETQNPIDQLTKTLT